MTDNTPPEISEVRKRGLAKMSQVYGWEFRDGPGEHFAVTADHLFADIWSRPALSVRDRRLLLLGALAAQGLFDVADIQVGAAYRNGELDETQLREAALFLCHYVGWPQGTALDGVVGSVVGKEKKKVRTGDRLRYGIVLFTSDRGITPAAAARAAEQTGFHSFYVPEHTHIPVRRDAAHPQTGDASLPDDRYMRTLDPWVALSTAAAVTDRIELATAVALPVEHDPITLAKTIASLDHLSGGRVVLGAGFGWNTDELTDHGVPPGKRRTVLREYLEAMRALWSEDEAGYSGEYVRFGPSWAWPKPPKRSVPVLIGAAGTERTFRWIAESADGWITTPGETDVTGRLESLQRIWHEAGRTGRPRVVALDLKPDKARLSEWAEAGVTDVLYGLPDKSDSDVRAYLDRLSGKLPDIELPADGGTP